MASTNKAEDVEIDDSLYSRQQLMLGAEAMKRMAKSSVLIAGLGGLGVEIAKNVGLAGIKALTLNDNKVATWLDLSTNFYLTPNDIGKNRAQVVIKHIGELNPYVKYEVTDHDLSKVDLSYFDQFTCVILTDSPLSEQVRVNDYCHSKNIRFIGAEVRGLYTYTFCDFGTDFEIFDKDGEELREVLIESVTQENPGIVKTLNGEKHQFEDGDHVTFREVRGMTELNGTTHTIKIINPSTFSIGDTTGFSAYQREGIVSQKKQTIKVTHKKLSESIVAPEFVVADFAKYDYPDTLHIGLRALHAFYDAHSRFPAPWNKSEADELIKIANDINSKTSSPVQLNEKLLHLQAYTSQGSIVPLTSFTGGLAAQECLKALSGKYTPLKQWMHLDAIELMEPVDSNPDNFQPSNNRSDGQTICVGKALNQKLADLKLFMIGCGAIGCEMLKNFAMLGVSTSEKGVITVTDNDLIEKSNLNRQFLFRSKDIQKPKSESAANAVKSMNPEIRISAHLDKVGPDTQAKYSDEFFDGLDVVVNALDNVNARLYVDQRCVTNRKPLLESGTLGPKGHVQVIIPHKTESYGSQRDPPEKDVPFCTLKSFPNLIEHCIEWARDFSFGGLFISKPMQWSQLLDQDRLVERLNAGIDGGLDLKIIRTAAKLVRTRPKDFAACLEFARQKYEAYFVNKALQLLHSFPLDHKVDDKGTLFWTSPKRPPMVLKFDWNDPQHRNFVLTLANLYAEVWGVPRISNMEEIRKIVEATPIAPFKPKEGKKIETDTSVKKEAAESAQSPIQDDFEIHLKELAKFFQSNPNPFRLKPLDFEKDDDTNFHIDFISATANLRARMYAIPEVDRLKVKAIAGRIMPAIATTTSCVSGCVALELMKLVRNSENLSDFKNLFMNLALPFWSFSEPGPVAKQYITKEMYFTLWDNWEVKEGDITLGQFIDYFQKKYNLKVGGVLNGAMMIYVPLFPGHAKRKPQKMAQLLKKGPEDKYVDLIVTFTDEEDKDVSGPPIRFHY